MQDLVENLAVLEQDDIVNGITYEFVFHKLKTNFKKSFSYYGAQWKLKGRPFRSRFQRH